MLIINADDFGKSRKATDNTLVCMREKKVSSASAMVFMGDSERAAELALKEGIKVGLHLNFTQRFSSSVGCKKLNEYISNTSVFLKKKYNALLYNPILKSEFNYLYNAQFDEFLRLYKSQPAHIDGHEHMHLCMNVILGQLIPRGTKVRRNHTFWPGEKNVLNCAYRKLLDRWLSSKYQLTDFFFDLAQNMEPAQVLRIASLSQISEVELMVHPDRKDEFEYLRSNDAQNLLGILLSYYRKGMQFGKRRVE